MDVGAGRGDGRRTGIGTGHAEDAVPGGDQFPDHGRADEAGRAGDEYTHGKFSGLLGPELISAYIYSGK